MTQTATCPDPADQPCEIGQFYDVPVVTWKFCSTWSEWPFLGPLHEDREIIGLDNEHFHVDWRFLRDSQLAAVERFCSGTGSRPASLVLAIPHGVAPPKPFTKRLRCERPMPEFVFEAGQSGPPWLAALQDAFEGRRLSRDLICPHRGADLSTVEPDAEGVITCPLHYLRWCSRTGELVR